MKIFLSGIILTDYTKYLYFNKNLKSINFNMNKCGNGFKMYYYGVIIRVEPVSFDLKISRFYDKIT
jgi:hypothetical protein